MAGLGGDVGESFFFDLGDELERISECIIAHRYMAFGIDNIEHGAAIFGVGDDEFRRISEFMDMIAKEIDAESVKSADVSGEGIADDGFDALPHFEGGFVCERNAQDVFGENADARHEVGKTAREGARFARTCAGNDADIAFGRSNGVSLGFVEIVENVGELCHREGSCRRRSPSFMTHRCRMRLKKG